MKTLIIFIPPTYNSYQQLSQINDPLAFLFALFCMILLVMVCVVIGGYFESKQFTNPKLYNRANNIICIGGPIVCLLLLLFAFLGEIFHWFSNN